MYDTVGAPWAVCISAGPHQYLYSSNSFPTGNNFDQASTTGEIYKMELDAQQVRVDPQDNVWIVDAGSNQVVKFSADGRFQMVLGRKPESITLRPGPGVSATAADAAFLARGAAPEAGRGGGGGRGGNATPGAGINGDNFNRPSDVTWDRAGNVYVADGFGTNSRIAKFTKDGNVLKTWGHTGSAQGQVNQIRGIRSRPIRTATCTSPKSSTAACKSSSRSRERIPPRSSGKS